MFKTLAEYIQAVLWQGWWPLVGAVLTMVEIARRSLPPRLALTKALKWTPKRWLVVTLVCLGVAQFLAFRELGQDSEKKLSELQARVQARDALLTEGKIGLATLTGSKTTLETQLAQRASVDTSNPAIYRHRKTGHLGSAVEAGDLYLTAVSVRKSVCTLVRQLRGPHLRTWAWWSKRSSSAVTAAVSPRSLPQSSTGRFDVRMVEARS